MDELSNIRQCRFIQVDVLSAKCCRNGFADFIRIVGKGAKKGRGVEGGMKEEG